MRVRFCLDEAQCTKHLVESKGSHVRANGQTVERRFTGPDRRQGQIATSCAHAVNKGLKQISSIYLAILSPGQLKDGGTERNGFFNTPGNFTSCACLRSFFFVLSLHGLRRVRPALNRNACLACTTARTVQRTSRAELQS